MAGRREGQEGALVLLWELILLIIDNKFNFLGMPLTLSEEWNIPELIFSHRAHPSDINALMMSFPAGEVHAIHSNGSASQCPVFSVRLILIKKTSRSLHRHLIFSLASRQAWETGREQGRWLFISVNYRWLSNQSVAFSIQQRVPS